MELTNNMYAPSLRWRQGEYQALFHLSESEKDKVVPLITVPDIEYDFEAQKPKHTVQEHVYPFAKRYKSKWGKRPAWIAVAKSLTEQSMDDGRDVSTYVFDEIRKNGGMAVPAVALNESTKALKAARQIQSADARGVGLVIRLEDVMKPNLGKRIDSLASQLGVTLSQLDLILDLGAPNFEPYELLAAGLEGALGSLESLKTFRNFVLVSSAIPTTYAKGEEEVPRHDWLFYLALRSKFGKKTRSPNFGDYTVVHPEFKALDMRKIKSAGKLIYSTAKAWEVRKGGAFRDNPAQMHAHCSSIVNSGKFRGAAFSPGDDFIAKCAVKAVGPSNQSRWKGVAINHHISQVLDDLSKTVAGT